MCRSIRRRAPRLVPGPTGENASPARATGGGVAARSCVLAAELPPRGRLHHPGVGQAREGYEDAVATLTQELLGLLAELKRDVPLFSGRYKGHMIAEQTIAAQVGWFATMLYNPNNIAMEISPVTTRLEMEVARSSPG